MEKEVLKEETADAVDEDDDLELDEGIFDGLVSTSE
jgi:hypothetical protein